MRTVRSLADMTWLFVGCGGTFWASLAYMKILARRIRPPRILFVDPDILTTDNQDRQWAEVLTGESKAMRGFTALQDALHPTADVALEPCMERFSPTTMQRVAEDEPVLAIVNVDNNAARLTIRETLMDRRDTVNAMIVSGCDAQRGQCYPGVWRDTQPMLDWLEFAPDLADISMDGLTPPCGGQTIFSNVATGLLVGRCMEDLDALLQESDSDNFPDPLTLNSYWWGLQHDNLFRSWTQPLYGELRTQEGESSDSQRSESRQESSRSTGNEEPALHEVASA